MSVSKMMLSWFSFLVFLLSCTPPQETLPGENSDPQNPVDSISTAFLALGDSYTIGHSVSEQQRFPVQLLDSLKAEGYPFETVQIIAKTGWTTDELQTAINATEDLEESYGLVSLLIGVNNQYRGRPVKNYIPEFEALLQQAIDFADGNKDRVIVVSIPDYAYTPFGNGRTEISEGIDEYNAANKQITESYGIRYIDITPISREGLDHPELVASDGLHPSGEQYTRWVSAILPVVRDLLKE